MGCFYSGEKEARDCDGFIKMKCPMTALAFQLTACRLGALKLYDLLMAMLCLTLGLSRTRRRLARFPLGHGRRRRRFMLLAKGQMQRMRAVRAWIGRMRGELATSGLPAYASGAQRGTTDGTVRCVPFHFISCCFIAQSLRDTSNRWGPVPTVSSRGLSDW